MKTVQKYYEYLDEIEFQRKEKLWDTMEVLHSELTKRLEKKGWTTRGKGGITQTMVNSNIGQFHYVRGYNGETVTITLKVNFREDYGNGGYKELILKGGKSMKGVDGWWPRKEGSNWDFEVRSDGFNRFYLEKLLDDLERENS